MPPREIFSDLAMHRRQKGCICGGSNRKESFIPMAGETEGLFSHGERGCTSTVPRQIIPCF